MPWTAACQASLSFTISRSLLKFMSIESVTPSNHLVLCCPLLLLPSIFPRIRVFSNESALCIRWPKYWRISFSIILSVCKCWQLVHLKNNNCLNQTECIFQATLGHMPLVYITWLKEEENEMISTLAGCSLPFQLWE